MKIDELLHKYGLTESDVDFKYVEMSSDEIERRLVAIRDAKFADEEEGSDGDDDAANDSSNDSDGGTGEGGSDPDESDDGSDDDSDEDEGSGEPDAEPAFEDDNDDAPGGAQRQYQLTGEQMYMGVLDALHTVLMTDEWGSWPRYCYTDYDPNSHEVYAYDNEDWNLYGFKYTMNGDNVVIDFDSKKRKKLAFVDFDNGSTQFSYQHMMDSVNARFATVVKEVGELRAYKKGVEADARKAQEDEVFAKFADLSDDDSFMALRANCAEMSIQDIEDKCFAIRGRKVKMQFSATPGGVRLPVEDTTKFNTDEPYGGIFVTYGVGQ